MTDQDGTQTAIVVMVGGVFLPVAAIITAFHGDEWVAVAFALAAFGVVWYGI